MNNRVLHFTVEELESEIDDLMRKIGNHRMPKGMIQKIVRDMEETVRQERLEKERQYRKTADSPDATFAEMELNQRAIFSAYAMSPNELARAGFPVHYRDEEKKPECPACEAGIPVRTSPNSPHYTPGGERLQYPMGFSIKLVKLREKVKEAFSPTFLPVATLRKAAEQDSLVGAIVRARLPDIIPDKTDACECGAHKIHGAPKGNPTHSSWCPWSKP